MAHHGHPLGTHRVISPANFLPQAAQVINPALPLYDNEILVDVSLLQIDAASFKSLINQAQGSQIISESELKKRVEQIILHIVKERGKMHNPITNSGGVFFGTVSAIGSKHPAYGHLKIGSPIVSLVSLTLTPLIINKITSIDIHTDRIAIKGQAILFESGLYSTIPSDLPEGSVMAMLDVCGAPAQVNRYVTNSDTVLVLGLGKAGKSMVAAANEKGSKVFGLDVSSDAVNWCQKNLSGTFGLLTDNNPLTAANWLMQNNGNLASWVFNATNQDTTEMATILCAQEGGSVMFFGMNTAFQRAVLGAEGIGRDVHLHMGSGYVPGHAEFALNLLRRNKNLREWFDGTFI